MKHCPKCKREYEDDSLRFCLEDGTALSGDKTSSTPAPPTMVMPANEQSATTISRVGRPDVPLPGKAGGPETHLAPARLSESPSSAGTVRIIITVLLVLAVIVTLVSIVVWGGFVVRRLPITLLFLAVMMLAIIRAGRHPKVSLLAGLALGFDLIETFLYIIVNRSLSQLQDSMKIPAAQIQTFHTILIILDDLVLGAVMILLTAAVLTQRTSQTKIE